LQQRSYRTAFIFVMVAHQQKISSARKRFKPLIMFDVFQGIGEQRGFKDGIKRTIIQ